MTHGITGGPKLGNIHHTCVHVASSSGAGHGDAPLHTTFGGEADNEPLANIPSAEDTSWILVPARGKANASDSSLSTEPGSERPEGPLDTGHATTDNHLSVNTS